MKFANNVDKHKISNKFEYQPDRNIDLRDTCPFVPTNKYIRPCPEQSLFSFDWMFMKVAKSITSQTSSNSIKIRLFAFLIRLCPEHRLCILYPILMTLADKQAWNQFHKIAKQELRLKFFLKWKAWATIIVIVTGFTDNTRALRR